MTVFPRKVMLLPPLCRNGHDMHMPEEGGNQRSFSATVHRRGDGGPWPAGSGQALRAASTAVLNSAADMGGLPLGVVSILPSMTRLGVPLTSSLLVSKVFDIA